MEDMERSFSREALPKINSKWEDVVFTTFLTSKKDPHRNVFMKNDNYSYMADWHLSLRDVGIKAIMFHDGLGDQFRCVSYIFAIFSLLTICQVLLKSALLMKTTAILNGSANETLLTKVIRSRPFASA